MRRCSVYLMVALLMTCCMVLVGCGSSEKVPEASSPPVAEEEKGSSNENELEKIMNSAKEVTDLSFEVESTVTGSDQTMTTHSKYWISGKKMRVETETVGITSIMIANGNGEAWVYSPTEKMAMKIPDIEVPNDLPNEWSEEEDLDNYKIIGHEKMNGYDCVVVSISGDEGTLSKMWLTKDQGMPIRMETESAEGKIVVEYKNYNLGKQPEDLFQLPADAQVMDMSQLPNIPE
ncbi:MAG: outer membrane lipoprotein carrier protein LolA [Syntrophomonadaceae bacterium]|nr:outer membrane lipoprotein carrier protein LolA [Syntrophomonadaceae bacterium]